MKERVLHVPEVSKTFAGTTVLHSVGIDLRAGEVRGLAGLNGSGKSTFIKILAGVHQPDRKATGSLNGQAFALGDHDAAHAAGMRFVHQDLGLIDNLDAVDNVSLGAAYRKRRGGLINWRASQRQVKDVLGELGYEFDLSAPVRGLSAPQRTGIAIARALFDWRVGERVLVLDEPTAALPAGETHNLFRAIERVRDRGVPVMIVTHHLDEIMAVTDSVTVLRNGSLITTHATAGLTQDDLVELMIGGSRSRRTTSGFAVNGSARPVLQVSALRTEAIREVDLTVREGEIVGVAGLAGSGRDQLLPALIGVAKRHGSVLLDGSSLKPGSSSRAIAAGIGYVPAERRRSALFPTFDLRANITIAELAQVQRRGLINGRRERAEVRDLIEKFEIVPPRGEASILALSGGNQQKAVVARSLRRTLRLLMLDEPTQGVDVAARESIYAAVRQTTAIGAALVSSSDLEELVALCHRVYVFYQGKVVAELTGYRLRVDVMERLCLTGAEEAE